MAVEPVTLRLPRPLRAVHQLELTSVCNLACTYCLQNTKHNEGLNKFGTEVRPRMHMDERVFQRALAWVGHFRNNPEQHIELNLAGVGESTLHPQFVDFVRRARGVIGDDVPLTVTTNGILVTDDLARAVKPYNLRFFVSLHRPEKAGRAVEILRAHGLLEGVSTDPSLAAIDWAGQVRWHVSAPEGRACPWIRLGWAFVMADGRVSTCCLDGSGTGVVAHVDDDPAAARVAPYDLCAACDQEVGVVGYEQYPRGKPRRSLEVLP